MINPETISNVAIFEMLYQMWYKETPTAVSKFKKSNLPPTWNALFTILFKSFSERVTGNDCASKLFIGLMYGLYTGLNVDYGSILWAQLIQSTHSVARHSEISCARCWTIIVNKAIKQLKIPVMSDALISSIATLHTNNIIVANRSKFSFIVSIPDVMFRDVPPSSKILEGYRALTPSGPHPLFDEFQFILAEADKAKKGGRGSKKKNKKVTTKEGASEAEKSPSKKRKAPATSTVAPKRRKQPARKRKSPTSSPSHSEGEDSDSETESNICIEQDPIVHNKEDEPIHTEEHEPIRIEEVE
ncbi:unnamed protein product [Lactuca saligna]|uniref:Uncharacterized protein n=1 Tax=Lactuca saligna TaxID=75948 RepID=A0AA35YQM2_LACSI|nr:unnamed protein product [Lactuca saligna]